MREKKFNCAVILCLNHTHIYELFLSSFDLRRSKLQQKLKTKTASIDPELIAVANLRQPRFDVIGFDPQRRPHETTIPTLMRPRVVVLRRRYYSCADLPDYQHGKFEYG